MAPNYNNRNNNRNTQSNEPIIIRVRDQTGKETFFKIRKTTKFSNIFNTYEQRKGVPISSLCFVLNEERIEEAQTAEELGLVDQDHIDCNYSIMRLTAKQLGFSKTKMKKINEKYRLQGYPKSKDFGIGYKHYDNDEEEEAITSFIHGAVTYGCVACSFFYAELQVVRGNMHLALPFYFESAIRGHPQSMSEIVKCYSEAKPQPALAFQNFWMKIMNEMGDTIYTKEIRLAWKKIEQSICAHCGEESDYEDMISKKWCGGCRLYSYCGRDCQLENWKTNEDGGCNHIGECRQLKILKHHYRRDVVKIREAIIRGDNPKDITRLQTLRTLLGLSRPKEDYDELLSLLSDDDKQDISKSPNRCEYLTARKDGTVWIGSTPNNI
eukprot:CAMPEP_0170761370 /NCGR_PEP_ID=MMETSP0733-20121128/2130_1 /TAXON_ID=186038 /ORGANISM="Fragilariopsis kerguelensis, Strain L26-C5" /LENGTH=380 /DNA_ID=CAMNT_0011101339 /DNA_START=213 /DNA_END=1355 /DNA_ORIENTATION=-